MRESYHNHEIVRKIFGFRAASTAVGGFQAGRLYFCVRHRANLGYRRVIRLIEPVLTPYHL